MSLRERFGWNNFFEQQIGGQELRAACSGRAWWKSSAGCTASPATSTAGPRSAGGSATRPRTRPISRRSATGWASSSGIIHRRLDRRSTVSRAAAGRAVDEQVLAANVDTIFLVTALGQDLNATAARTLPDDGVGRGRRAGGRAEQVRPLRQIRTRSRRRCPRAAAARRRPRRQRAARRPTMAGSTALAPYLRPAQTVALARLVRRRQVDARQPAARPRGAERPARSARPTARASTRRRRGSSWSCRAARC